MPEVDSLAALNELVATGDTRDDLRHVAGRHLSIAAHFALEAPLQSPLPAESFDVALALNCRVDTKSRICVRQCFYSVPVRFAGRRLDVALGADSVCALDGAAVVARHARAAGKGVETLELDHYLEVLAIKPGALAGASALVRARRSGSFTPTHQRFWDHAREQVGDQAGTRALIGVLLLHRTMTAAALEAGMCAALSVGSIDPEVVALEARRSLGRPAPVVLENESLAVFDRPTPTLGPLRRPARSRLMAKMTDTAAAASIGAATRELHLPTVRTESSRLAEMAQRGQSTYLGYLAEVLAAEVDDRSERRRQRRVHEARFPRIKRLADFDLSAAPGVNAATISMLASCGYLEAGDPVVLLGDSGTGKSHLLARSCGFGVAAACRR